MSGGLAPSKSTVYVSNLPFSLTNNDLHKVFQKYGQVVKVTVVKDRQTRRSKGVAFVLFLNKEDASNCIKETNGKEIFGRTLKSSMAKDNGRAAEFIRRRNYPDKSRCYECGEEGHLSYKCPSNALGERNPPPKKRKRNKGKSQEGQGDEGEEDEEESGGENDDETLSAAIRYQQLKMEEEAYRMKVATGDYNLEQSASQSAKRIKKNTYFSDEEDVSD